MISDKDLAKSPRWSVYDVDNSTRAIIWGYPGSKELYAETSCKGMVQHINKPFMMILSDDDPVSLDEDVPKEEILGNENSLILKSVYGTHCDLLSKNDKDLVRFFP